MMGLNKYEIRRIIAGAVIGFGICYGLMIIAREFARYLLNH